MALERSRSAWGCLLATACIQPVVPGELISEAPEEPTETSDAGSDSDDTSSENSPEETSPAETSPYEGQEGAIVTSDCTYSGYAYAIDILLSCGNERFDDELRLHTFKRHAYDHRRVFNDQRLTYRQNQLWFDGYNAPRCMTVDEQGDLLLSLQEQSCATIRLDPIGDQFQVIDAETGRCLGLGGAVCEDHQWTGGLECGGIEHRYLPLQMGSCENALAFQFESVADSCGGEYPEESCF